jgi:formamidopyrimidine-DNA glycosylase
MPELPEVETVVRELQVKINGKTIADINILWHKTVTGDHCEFLKAVKGHKVTTVSRRGKYICLNLDSGDCITVHLRMTGKMVFEPTDKDKNHIRTLFYFTDGTTLYFVDCRKFGRIKRWVQSERLLPKLGPEPLLAQHVLSALHKLTSRRAIKTLLLDQTVLAGVGNIYADEALFLAGIHPETPAYKVPETGIKKLSQLIPFILDQAIKNRGTTISDYRSPDQSKGGNQFYLKVYSRENEPCLTCGTKIKRIRINNRSSHLCPKCQRKTVVVSG